MRLLLIASTTFPARLSTLQPRSPLILTLLEVSGPVSKHKILLLGLMQ